MYKYRDFAVVYSRIAWKLLYLYFDSLLEGSLTDIRKVLIEYAVFYVTFK